MTDIETRYQLIRTIPADFLHAAELTRQHPLKAYDAVYLAVALRYHGLLAARNEALTFVSGDNALLTAADAQNLTTDNPFNHIQPTDHSSRAGGERV